MPRLAGWRAPTRSTDTGMLASGQLTSPGVPMSTPTAGAIQRARLLAAGLCVTDLPRLRDVDTAADAVAVARQAPLSSAKPARPVT